MRIGLVATLALVLCACGSKDEQGAAGSQAAATAVAQLGDESVAAVLDSNGTPFARLRFVLESRPVVGKSFNVRLTVITDAPVPQLLVTPESKTLIVEPANVLLAVGHAGDTGRQFTGIQVFSVTAREEGLAELAVHLTMEGNAPEALYTIPVLVAKNAK